MIYFVLAFNAAVVLVGCIILINPPVVYEILRRYKGTVWLYFLAIFLRLILGLALLTVAPVSKFPLILQIIGYLALAVALVFAAMGRSRFDRLIDWAYELSLRLGRLSGLIAVAFGGFIVYALL